jgi:sugar phosphate isomerase/epimerase
MHASDRFPGEYRHSVVGEGAVDFDSIFRCLAAIGYDGFISLEDGNPEGDEGTGRGLRFLRRMVVKHWR